MTLVVLWTAAGCSVAASDSTGTLNDQRGGLGKADDYGLPGNCAGQTAGKSPDGCWCDAECCEYADCCEHRMDACFGGPQEPSSPTPRLELEAGKGKIVLNGQTAIELTLQPDGTAGMTYILSAAEGFVCGQLQLSKWDPFNEGYRLTNEVAVSWLAPDGSVADVCAAEMKPLEGIYAGTTNSWQGTFNWAKPMPGQYALSLQDGAGVLMFNGQVIFDGLLQPDGSAGLSYNLIEEEGFVCGTFYLSKWDPQNEGSVLANAINVQWRKPDGSVANSCGVTYANASGIYSGDSDAFVGFFTK